MIAHFLAGMAGGFDPGFSWAAFFQLGLALAPAPTVAEAEAFDSSALFSTKLGRSMSLAGPVWPALEPDPVPDAVPDSDVPILMLNGTIDPQTSIEGARALAERLAGPNRYFVELPHTLHGAVWASQTEASQRGEELPCGAQIEREFIASPEVAPDTSCLAAIIPISIGSTPDPVARPRAGPQGLKTPRYPRATPGVFDLCQPASAASCATAASRPSRHLRLETPRRIPSKPQEFPTSPVAPARGPPYWKTKVPLRRTADAQAEPQDEPRDLFHT